MMFARSEGSLRPRRASTSSLLPSQAAQTSVAKHQGVLLLAAAKPPQIITAPEALSKSRAASGAHLVVLAYSNNFGEPQSVPAILRRHAARVHLPCIRADSRFSDSANGNFQFETKHTTALFLSIKPILFRNQSIPARAGVVVFCPSILFQFCSIPPNLPGNSRIGKAQKLQVFRLGVSLSRQFS